MSMKLLEIDGKTPPGQKPLNKEMSMKLLEIDGKTPPEEESSLEVEQQLPPPKAFVAPKLNSKEVAAVAARKSMNLRESVLERAFSGPSPRGIDHKTRSAIDSLIFQAAGKGKASQATEVVASMDIKGGDIMESNPALTSPTRPKQRTFGADVVTRGTVLSGTDRSAIQNLSDKLDKVQIAAPAVKSGFTGEKDDPMYQVRLQQVKYEKKTLGAKLAFKEAEMAKVEAEQEELKAKMLYVKAEYDMINNMLKTYDDAEAKLESMI